MAPSFSSSTWLLALLCATLLPTLQVSAHPQSDTTFSTTSEDHSHQKVFHKCSHSALNYTVDVGSTSFTSPNALGARATTTSGLRLAFETSGLESDLSSQTENLNFVKTRLLPLTQAWFNSLLTPKSPSTSTLKFSCATATCYCSFAKVPSSVISTGISDADMVIFVTASNGSLYGSSSPNPCATENSGTLAFASACTIDPTSSRPVFGAINFCPGKLTASGTLEVFMQQVTTTIHEVTHALALSSNLYPFWLDSNGARRSNSTSVFYGPIVATQVKVATESGSVNGTSYFLKTEAAIREARSHFGCSSLTGVELEDQGGNGTNVVHLEKRIYGEDFMTGVIVDGSDAPFSRISLAIYEDSGWYTVNYSMAHPLLYGRNRGCSFAQSLCNLTSASEFCFSGDSEVCSANLGSMTSCVTNTYTTSLPAGFQYFSDPKKGGFQLADFCPIGVTYSFSGQTGVYSSCRSSETSSVFQQGKVQGSGNYTAFHRCLKSTLYSSGTGSNMNGLGCYALKCLVDSSNNTVVQILLTKSVSINCTASEEGIAKQVSGYKGSIICPEIARACPAEAACPATCSLRGSCIAINSTHSGCLCHPALGGQTCNSVNTGSTLSTVVPAVKYSVVASSPGGTSSAGNRTGMRDIGQFGLLISLLTALIFVSV